VVDHLALRVAGVGTAGTTTTTKSDTILPVKDDMSAGDAAVRVALAETVSKKIATFYYAAWN
jgi:hypothetical protein